MTSNVFGQCPVQWGSALKEISRCYQKECSHRSSFRVHGGTLHNHWLQLSFSECGG